MKKIELIVMKLRNFKGIKELDIQVDGGNADIFGDNATGKTTLFDAFTWLLFEKDSANKTKFAIKTLVDGKEVHNLEHSVEATLLINGSKITLRKVYYEVWTKPKGTAVEEFGGHKVKNYIDGVPISTQKEYKARIAEIIDEDIFKLITSPTFFNEQLKWEDKRKTLLEIAGTVSDEEVIASNSELASLPTIIENRTVENTKKMIIEQQREINNELKSIPALINENQSMKPELTIDVKALEVQVQKLEKEIDELKTQRHNVLNGAVVLEKQKQLQEMDMKLNDLKRSFETESTLDVHKAKAKLQEVQGNTQIINNKLQQADNNRKFKSDEANRIHTDIGRLTKEMDELREMYFAAEKEQFHYEDKCECPTCKQALPVEQVEDTRNEALAQFNEKRTNSLNNIQREGGLRKEQVAQLNTYLSKLNNENDVLVAEMSKYQDELSVQDKELTKAQKSLETAQSAVQDVTTTDTYQSIIAQKQVIEDEIMQLKEHANEALADIAVSISELNQQKQSLNAEIAQFANIASIDKRIKELEEKQVDLSKEFEALERQIFIIDSFTRTKVKMLDERINSEFKYARFKLFRDQNNGGLEEMCETLYDGVPYSQGLNNAARINVGLDIINTLSAHYGVLAPIFIDNAEAVTQLIDSDSQLIALVVSEKDKQLRVETSKNDLAEAI